MALVGLVAGAGDASSQLSVAVSSTCINSLADVLPHICQVLSGAVSFTSVLPYGGLVLLLTMNV